MFQLVGVDGIILSFLCGPIARRYRPSLVCGEGLDNFLYLCTFFILCSLAVK